MSEFKSIYRETMAQAIPAVLGFLITFSQETISLIFIGSLNSSVQLAAFGMGNIFINMFAYSVYFGMNGAIDTLVSQARGAGDMKLCGQYLQRGRIVNTVIYVPLLCIFLSSGPILSSSGQSLDVSKLAS